MKKYKASITSSLFWVQESRTTAQYICSGMSRSELCKLSREENIFMAPSDDRKRKIANTTYDRITKLPLELIQELSTCSIEEAKLITLLSIMLTDDLFHDFMIEVFKEKVVLGLNKVNRNDVIIYLENKKTLYESVKRISEPSFYKLGQTYIKFLIEAGLVDNPREGNILKPYIDYKFIQLLEMDGLKDYITIITGE
jgi:hypothetical protein